MLIVLLLLGYFKLSLQCDFLILMLSNEDLTWNEFLHRLKRFN